MAPAVHFLLLSLLVAVISAYDMTPSRGWFSSTAVSRHQVEDEVLLWERSWGGTAPCAHQMTYSNDDEEEEDDREARFAIQYQDESQIMRQAQHGYLLRDRQRHLDSKIVPVVATRRIPFASPLDLMEV